MGGEDNPGRVEAVVEKGDVVVVPADAGHRLLDYFSSGFEMVGSYPKGISWDMCHGREEEEEQIEVISRMGRFERNPLYGDYGPVIE